MKKEEAGFFEKTFSMKMTKHSGKDSPSKVGVAKTEIERACGNVLSPEENRRKWSQHAINVINVYTNELSGDHVIDSKLGRIRNFFTKQLNRVRTLFNKQKNKVDFMSAHHVNITLPTKNSLLKVETPASPSPRRELYQAMVAEKNI